MLRIKVDLLLLGGMIAIIVAFTGLTTAQSEAPAADPADPVVVELFTSQSCYSCPPAEAYLGALVGRPGIVALEWHVDYWNDIHYGNAGQWIDPYSEAAYTARQRAYNQAIRGTGAVYTPQMVIDGRLEAVGSRRDDVEAAIGEAAARPAEARIEITHTADDALGIALDGSAARGAAVWLVRFLSEETVHVPRGENHGKTLTNHHVVTEAVRLGDWYGGPASFAVPQPAAGSGCAVLVQPDGEGPILAAAECPAPTS
jgi:hypothetical protein